MAYDHFCVPICKDAKQYDSGKDLSSFNFLRDEQQRNRTPSLEYKQGDCLCPSSLVANPKWRQSDNLDDGVYSSQQKSRSDRKDSDNEVKILLTPCNCSLGQVVK